MKIFYFTNSNLHLYENSFICFTINILVLPLSKSFHVSFLLSQDVWIPPICHKHCFYLQIFFNSSTIAIDWQNICQNIFEVSLSYFIVVIIVHFNTSVVWFTLMNLFIFVYLILFMVSSTCDHSQHETIYICFCSQTRWWEINSITRKKTRKVRLKSSLPNGISKKSLLYENLKI